MKTRVTVATIDGREVKDLRRLVDLLCAIQVTWPSSEATFHDGAITVTVLRVDPLGPVAA